MYLKEYILLCSVMIMYVDESIKKLKNECILKEKASEISRALPNLVWQAAGSQYSH